MYRFHIPDMECGGCLDAAARAIRTVDPAARIEGNLKIREVTFVSTRAETALLSVLRDAGYLAGPALAPVA